MKKSDLNLLYLVITRDGTKWLIAESIEGLVLVQDKLRGWVSLADYNNDLTMKRMPNLDIMKVYSLSKYATYSLSFDEHDRGLIWERVGPKEMTVEQIEKELGYKIKIVGGNE